MKFVFQIKAFLLLLIMLFAMMHNAVPHVHHIHYTVKSTKAESKPHQHHHSKHHHHSHKDEGDHEEKTFFDFFNSHSHSNHTHEYTHVNIEQVKSAKKSLIKLYNWDNADKTIVQQKNVGLHRYVLSRNKIKDSLYLFSHKHRGPPKLA